MHIGPGGSRLAVNFIYPSASSLLLETSWLVVVVVEPRGLVSSVSGMRRISLILGDGRWEKEEPAERNEQEPRLNFNSFWNPAKHLGKWVANLFAKCSCHWVGTTLEEIANYVLQLDLFDWPLNGSNTFFDKAKVKWPRVGITWFHDSHKLDRYKKIYFDQVCYIKIINL